MSIQWAGLGPELLLQLDRELPESLRSQLERGLRDAIRCGRLEPGERLPSSRVLARELGISRGLVLECYMQLQAEGYLTSRSGSATRVAGGAEAARTTRRRTAAPARPPIDFRAGLPDLTSFPRSDWAWAVREACRSIPADELGYGDARGSEELRRVMSAYLRRVRGAVVDPERIVIASGVLQGVNLLLRALATQGVKRVAFEDPGHLDHLSGTALAGIEPLPVRVDERGIDVEVLRATRASAVVLTPAHQWPTGVVLAPERRQALLAWAAERGATLIEDDYDAEFRYDREPVGTLQGLAPERVVTLGSVSKTLSPGLRLGWMLCPGHLVDAVASQKRDDDRSSPVVDQFALARLIESGRFDRHLRRMRGIYAARREALIRALERHAPGVAPGGLAAGFHVVLPLPGGVSEDEVVAAALERSVGVYGLAENRFGPDPLPPALVLGFGNLGEAAIERGIEAIADLLRGPALG